MKGCLLIFTLILFHSAYGQIRIQSKNIYFSKADFLDSSKYKSGINKLSTAAIALYSNPDKVAYYNDLFRLHFANNNYATTISIIDSFVSLAVPDKAYKDVPYFHYRVHCKAMIAMQENATNNYDTNYSK